MSAGPDVRRRVLAGILGLTLVGALAACGGAGADATPAATLAASPLMLEVTLDDTLAMTPSSFSIQKGMPVTFVVTNVGATAHEFVLGDDQAQAEHEQEMATESGMAMHAPPGVMTVEPGETKELSWRFETAGQTMAGCHFPGHYAAGMKSTITVTD